MQGALLKTFYVTVEAVDIAIERSVGGAAFQQLIEETQDTDQEGQLCSGMPPWLVKVVAVRRMAKMFQWLRMTPTLCRTLKLHWRAPSAIDVFTLSVWRNTTTGPSLLQPSDSTTGSTPSRPHTLPICCIRQHRTLTTLPSHPPPSLWSLESTFFCQLNSPFKCFLCSLYIVLMLLLLFTLLL